MNKSICKNIFFVSMFIVMNIFYFILYFYFLKISISWLNLLFSLFGSVSLLLLVLLSTNKIFKIISALFLLVYYFWTLLNFAYFTVFNSFLDFGTKQIGAFGVELSSLVKQYYFLVPYQLYLSVVVIWLAILIFLCLFIDKKELSNYVTLDKENLMKRSSFSKRIFLVVVFLVCINSLAIYTAFYYQKNPKDDWWDLRKQKIEIGLWGHVYFQVLKKANLDHYVFVSNAKEISQADFQSQSLLDKTKGLWQEISEYTRFDSSKIEVPQFEEKPNILIIQLETVANWTIYNNPSPMPFLKSLIEENISVPDFHANSCETINCEFSSLCSFWPDSFEPVPYSHAGNDYYCLPEILNKKYNYQTYFFHANDSSFWSREVLLPKWGFDNLYFIPYFRLREYDGSVFSRALEILKTEQEPWFSYLVSYTTHGPHNQDFINYNKITNDIVIEPYSGQINEKFSEIHLSEEEVRFYLGYLTATDNALRELFVNLENTGLAKNTIVLIYNDHRYYGFEQNSVENFNNWHQQPFVMVLPQKIKAEIQPLASHIDIAPTVLNILQGDDYQVPNNFLGQSMFSDKYQPQVLNKCLGDIYFKNQNLIIKGNAGNFMFKVFKEMKEVDLQETINLTKLLQNLTKVSDEAIFSNALLP